MKTARIAKEKYVETKEMKVSNELGLDETDLASIRSRLVGAKEEKEELPYVRIESCTPYTVVLTDGNPVVATLMFLCKNKDTGDLFTMFHNYIIEDKEDYENIKNCYLYIDEQRTNNVLAYRMYNGLDQYNSDFDMFTIEGDDENAKDDDVLYTLGYIKNKDGGKVVKMYMNHNVANIILYTDDYLKTGDFDLVMDGYFQDVIATEGLNKVPTKYNDYDKYIFVKDIAQIAYVCIADKSAKAYNVVFKIDNPKSKNETDEYLSISTVMESKKKLRTNIDLKKYREIMFDKKERFHDVLSYECKINDKEYTAMKIVASVDEGLDQKMLFLDEDVMNKLEDMVQTEFAK